MTWGKTTSRDTGSVGITLDERQVEIIKKVSAYFNDLINLKGAFVQTGVDNKRMRCKRYVKRPGRTARVERLTSSLSDDPHVDSGLGLE
jgi:hypothetical protein